MTTNIKTPGDIILPNPDNNKEQDLYNTLQDYTKEVNSTFEELTALTTTDENVKASSSDTAGYLDAKVDDSTIEVSANKLQVKDGGITPAKLDSSIAGNGLTENSGILNVNVDGTTIEIVADQLQAIGATLIQDTDNDTFVKTEASADEDIIRMAARGVEQCTVGLSGFSLSNGTTVNEFSTDGTLGDDSDSAVPTEKAVKTYVDANVGGGSTFVSKTTSATTSTADISIDQGATYLVYWYAYNQTADTGYRLRFEGDDGTNYADLSNALNGTPNSYITVCPTLESTSALAYAHGNFMMSTVETDRMAVHGLASYPLPTTDLVTCGTVAGFWDNSETVSKFNIFTDGANSALTVLLYKLAEA